MCATASFILPICRRSPNRDIAPQVNSSTLSLKLDKNHLLIALCPVSLQVLFVIGFAAFSYLGELISAVMQIPADAVHPPSALNSLRVVSVAPWTKRSLKPIQLLSMFSFFCEIIKFHIHSLRNN